MLLSFNNPCVLNASLICIHHAGGNRNCFRQWGKELELNGIRLIGVNIPREITSDQGVQAQARAICEELISNPRLLQSKSGEFEKTVLFGHSLGGIIAFELARLLQEEFAGNILIDDLIVSAVKSPSRLSSSNSSETTTLNHKKTDADLFLHVVGLGGLPTGVDPEFLWRSMNDIRKDYKTFETYLECEQLHTSLSLYCNITAVGGSDDVAAMEGDLRDWQHFTVNKFDWKIYKGSHFYLQESPSKDDLVSDISNICLSSRQLPTYENHVSSPAHNNNISNRSVKSEEKSGNDKRTRVLSDYGHK